MSKIERDPVIDEVREARRRISQQVGNDPARLVERYMKLQEQHLDRILGAEPTEEKPKPAAA